MEDKNLKEKRKQWSKNWYDNKRKREAARKYRCEFPNCNYFTPVRTQIHRHHIVPREQGGSNKKVNRIDLCPTHHSFIYVPLSKKGIHCKRGRDSIILLGWKESTKGKVLHYIENEEEKFI